MYMMTPNYESQRPNKRTGALQMQLSYTSPKQTGSKQVKTKQAKSKRIGIKQAGSRQAGSSSVRQSKKTGIMQGGTSQAKSKQARKKPAFKLILCILLVMVLMLTAWIQEKSSSGQRGDDSALQDFSLLAQWGDELLSGGALADDWSFRWDLTLMQGTMEQLADQVFRTERGARLPKQIREHGSVIDGEAALPASYIKFTRTEQDRIAEKVTVLLQVEGSELDKLDALENYVTTLHHEFYKQDQNVQMSMKVLGKAKDSNALNSLKQLAVAQTVDEYVDRGTKSITLFSSQIKQYRWVNNEKMANLQAALHESSVDGEYTLTIGLPLISGEFGEAIDMQSDLQIIN